MNAADIMTRDVVSVHTDTTVAEIAQLLLERRVSAVPVIDAGRRVVGIVSEQDLLHQCRRDGAPRSWWLDLFGREFIPQEEIARSRVLTATDLMTSEPFMIDEAMPLEAIATVFERYGLKRAPVVRDGRLAGIVSRADLLAGFVHGPRNPPQEPEDDQC